MRAGLVALLAGLALGAAPVAAGDDSVLLATTTSVRDSGLLGALLPTFSERTGIRVRVVAVGTGAALRLGAEGNADLLLTHAPQAEEELVASGAAHDRDEIATFLSRRYPRELMDGLALDFLGDQSWAPYDILRVPASGYAYHVFPPGFSAHWVRFTAESDCTATAYLHYT